MRDFRNKTFFSEFGLNFPKKETKLLRSTKNHASLFCRHICFNSMTKRYKNTPKNETKILLSKQNFSNQNKNPEKGTKLFKSVHTILIKLGTKVLYSEEKL